MKATGTQQDIIIKDERLDIDHIDHYLLSFFISSTWCELTVLDERKHRLLMFESIKMDPEKSLLENLKEIHYEHILISAGFWKRVEVNLRNSLFCQVPASMYSGEHAYDYIRLNAPTDPLNEKYLSTLDDKQDCITVFSVPNDLIKWFDGKYPKPTITYRHESANYIAALKPRLDEGKQNELFLCLTQDEMLLAGYQGGKLSIYNQFVLKTPQQAAKMILLSIQQFSDEGQATSITLWGLDRHVKVYEPYLKKYFRNITHGGRPKGLKLSNVFDSLREYEYFDILGSFR